METFPEKIGNKSLLLFYLVLVNIHFGKCNYSERPGNYNSIDKDKNFNIKNENFFKIITLTSNFTWMAISLSVSITILKNKALSMF